MLLVCPTCHRLIHQETLERLAGEAGAATSDGRPTEALSLWRQALDLLPLESRQASIIRDKIAALRDRVDSGEERPASSSSAGQGAGGTAAGWGLFGLLGLLFWKLKFVLVFVATKIKFLFYGLSKGGTFLSMLVSFSAYWALWGWKFALGIVVSIYVHEMGHVAALTRYGMKASVPMFIPGLGALIRLKQYPTDPTEDSRIGLAGPLWGLGAVLVSYGAFLANGVVVFAAIAKISAWINLFNLLPIAQLDGGRGFRAMNRWQRFVIVLVTLALWCTIEEGLLILILVVAAVRACQADCPTGSGTRAFLEYLLLLGGLAGLSTITVALPAS